MADFIKITTPIVNKTQVPANAQNHNREPADMGKAIELSNIAKTVKPNADSEVLKQNSGLLQKDGPTLLMNLLKDPSLTVGFLKNISILQEFIKLLPVNNQTTIQEMHHLFDRLLIRPEDIVDELIMQEDASTIFKGGLFDYLRNLVINNQASKQAAANLLKSIYQQMGKQSALNSVANNLQFLADKLATSAELSARLLNLSELYRTSNAAENFAALKAETLSLMRQVENSILFTPKLEKIKSILIYNLSRFNTNSSFLDESIAGLLTQIDGKDSKYEFLTLMNSFREQMLNGAEKSPGRIMDTLAQIIGRQAENENLNILNGEKIEHIIHSLLSSPCNFTPLLHMVIPVEFMEMKSFAEIWIDPNGENPDGTQPEGAGKNFHVLIVFDIDGIGEFETELMLSEGRLNISLLCPTGYVDSFKGIQNSLAGIVSASEYKLGDLRIDKLESPRSLMEVFKALPFKRTGVDVKI